MARVAVVVPDLLFGSRVQGGVTAAVVAALIVCLNVFLVFQTLA